MITTFWPSSENMPCPPVRAATLGPDDSRASASQRRAARPRDLRERARRPTFTGSTSKELPDDAQAPRLAAATALALAPLAVAAQQTVDVTAYQEAEDDDMIVQPFNLTVDEIEDMDLKSAAGEEIGEVEEVLTDASGSRSRSASRSGASSASASARSCSGSTS